MKRRANGGYNSPEIELVNLRNEDVIFMSGELDTWVGDTKEWTQWYLKDEQEK